jgi:hypothetical protein
VLRPGPADAVPAEALGAEDRRIAAFVEQLGVGDTLIAEAGFIERVRERRSASIITALVTGQLD